MLSGTLTIRYEASWVQDDLWIVRRWFNDEPEFRDECQAQGNTAEEAIDFARKQNSWA